MPLMATLWGMRLTFNFARKWAMIKEGKKYSK